MLPRSSEGLPITSTSSDFSTWRLQAADFHLDQHQTHDMFDSPVFFLPDERNEEVNEVTPDVSSSLYDAFIAPLETEQLSTDVQPRRSSRAHHPPSYLKNFNCNLLMNKPTDVYAPYHFGKHLS